MNVFYTLFFAGVNLLIFLILQKSYQPKKLYLYLGGIVLVSLAHLFSNNEYLMNIGEFLNMSFYSIGIIIIHFGTNAQVSIFKRTNIPQNKQAEKVQERVLLVFDFMRQKLVYVMVTLFQFMAIWLEGLR